MFAKISQFSHFDHFLTSQCIFHQTSSNFPVKRGARDNDANLCHGIIPVELLSLDDDAFWGHDVLLTLANAVAPRQRSNWVKEGLMMLTPPDWYHDCMSADPLS